MKLNNTKNWLLLFAILLFTSQSAFPENDNERLNKRDAILAVSYTHLTLPTIA